MRTFVLTGLILLHSTFCFALPTARWQRDQLIGGTKSVDNIPYATLTDVINYDGHICEVVNSSKVHLLYRWNSASSASENSPWIIEPNDQSGNGRWELVEDDMIFKEVPWSIVDSDTAVATGNGVVALTIPASMNGMNLVDVVCSVHTKGITGATDIQVRRRRAGANVDVLSVKVTIGDEFYASDETINTSNDDVNTGDQYYLDIDAIHSGTAPNGLGCVLDFQVP